MTQLDVLKQMCPEGLQQYAKEITEKVTRDVTQKRDREALQCMAASVRNLAQSLGETYEQALDRLGTTIVSREDILEYLHREDAGEIT